jgi:hypothetical protein
MSRSDCFLTVAFTSLDWQIGYDGVRLTSQNCCPYRVICDVDHGMTISTEVNSKLVCQSALAATSTVLPAEISLERVGEWAKEMTI